MPNYVPNTGYKSFLNSHNITSQAGFIQANGWGYGQVEPNHLSAQASKEVYAQLPAKSNITILENGQFAKYNYVKMGFYIHLLVRVFFYTGIAGIDITRFKILYASPLLSTANDLASFSLT